MDADRKRTLKELLEQGEGGLNDEVADQEEGANNEKDEEQINPDLCIDCQRMPKELYCEDCDEPFCRVCFQFVHRGGKRKNHKVKVLVEEKKPEFENLDEEETKEEEDAYTDENDENLAGEASEKLYSHSGYFNLGSQSDNSDISKGY